MPKARMSMSTNKFTISKRSMHGDLTVDVRSQMVDWARDRRADRRPLSCPPPHHPRMMVSAPAEYSVIGLMKTGTNVMCAAMKKLNFGCDEATFWKHSVPALSDVGLIKDSGCNFVICIRDPLSWLKSLRRESYEYKWSGELRERVSIHNPFGRHSQADIEFRETMIQMWNTYCRAAIKLQERLPLQVTLFDFADLTDKCAMKRFFGKLNVALTLTDELYSEIFEKPQKGWDVTTRGRTTVASAKAHLEQAHTGWLDWEWDYLMKHVDWQAWKTLQSLASSYRE